MKKNMSLTFARTLLYGLLIFLKSAVIIFLIWFIAEKIQYVELLFKLISVFTVLAVASNNKNEPFKIGWIILILLFPLYGGTVYIIFRLNQRLCCKKSVMSKLCGDVSEYLPKNQDVFEKLEAESATALMQSRYIKECSSFPIYQNTTAEYLTPGQVKYSAMLDELKKAEKFIFLEYFIIDTGVMWDSILKILQQKVKDGVKVRVIYDDCGCKNLLPHNYCDELIKMGIECKIFNKFKPNLSLYMNNRDHRKILVIDGNIGFTGGINIADEYIGAKKPHGQWKDASIMIKGAAVWSMTVMFLTLWSENIQIDELKHFKPDEKFLKNISDDGFIQPYATVPYEHENAGKCIYLNMINRAEKYVYINIPYLIPDNVVITALCLAAKSGVDVRVVTPHIGDNWLSYTGTQANYSVLVRNGVKIYEYMPGFMHSKTFVCDDKMAIVGSINLDYRSLFAMLESAVWSYNSKVVLQVKSDFLQTLKCCEEITKEQWEQATLMKKIIFRIFRIFAPLL